MTTSLTLQSSTEPLATVHSDGTLSFQALRPARTIGLPDKTIWYFEKAPASRRDNRDCAYISHARGSKTFTMAYHPLDRNDQVVEDLPMEQLPAALNDLAACGFGPRPVKREPQPAVMPQAKLTSARPGLE